MMGNLGCSHNGGLVVLNAAHRPGTVQPRMVFNPLDNGLFVHYSVPSAPSASTVSQDQKSTLEDHQ
ncbi:MAG: hypothetical protein D6723_10575 [Acidobacteria bacterium]|nr:MAG: hypothetical protein D6723_10575 [Acidobacteriota bacterium]